jgi:dUTP pyrophosphatase
MEIKLLDKRLGQIAPATELSAGYDLRCCEDEEVVILPGQTVKIKTGIAVHMGHDANRFIFGNTMVPEVYPDLVYSAVIMPRSGLGCRGIRPRNVPGLIDADYQGEILLCMHNDSDDFVTIQPMDRIAQLVFMLALHPKFTVVEEFSNDSIRGSNGFGSTGVN